MDDHKVTTAGRLLQKLLTDDQKVLERLALSAAIPVERLTRAATGERSLRPMEQLRLAEWLIQHTPSLKRQAFALRAQVLAADRMAAGETECHSVAPLAWR
jgi:hypothetical protein